MGMVIVDGDVYEQHYIEEHHYDEGGGGGESGNLCFCTNSYVSAALCSPFALYLWNWQRNSDSVYEI